MAFSARWRVGALLPRRCGTGGLPLRRRLLHSPVAQGDALGRRLRSALSESTRFLRDHLFDNSPVNLEDAVVLRNLSEPAPGKLLFDYFKKAINALTVRNSGASRIEDRISPTTCRISSLKRRMASFTSSRPKAAPNSICRRRWPGSNSGVRMPAPPPYPR